MAVKEQVIFTDGAELILLLKGPAGSGRQPQNFLADKVQSVFFSYQKGGLFGKKSRRITITVPRIGSIEYDESTHKKYFEQYLQMMKEYCQKNRVTFHDFPEA